MERLIRTNSGSNKLRVLARGSIRRRIAKQCHSFSTGENQGTSNIVFIKDIIPNAGRETAERIIRSYQNYPTKQKNKVFIIGEHPSETSEEKHLHFYHTCSYTQSNCRCQFVRGESIKRRRPKDIVGINSIESKLFENIIEYLLQKPRSLLHIQIGENSFGEEIHRLENLSESESTSRDRSTELVEECRIQMQDGSGQEFSVERSDSSEIGRIEKFINQGYDNISRPRSAETGSLKKSANIDYLMRHILKILATPLESACQTQYWMEDSLLSIYDNSNSEYKLAVSNLHRLTQNLTFEQLFKLQTAPGCHSVYNQRSNNQHYLSIEESIEAVEQLLAYQYGPDNVSQFILRVYEICEKKIAKKNSMYVQGKNDQMCFRLES